MTPEQREKEINKRQKFLEQKLKGEANIEPNVKSRAWKEFREKIIREFTKLEWKAWPASEAGSTYSEPVMYTQQGSDAIALMRIYSHYCKSKESSTLAGSYYSNQAKKDDKETYVGFDKSMEETIRRLVEQGLKFEGSKAYKSNGIAH